MKKEIGYFGLGRMGKAMVQNLLDHGYRVAVSNRSPAPVDEMKQQGAVGVYTPEELVHELERPRALWLMVAAGEAVDDTIKKLEPHLSEDDILIDGGNSRFKDSIRRAKYLKDSGIHFLDIGTSGGIDGARNGACLMIGGDRKVYDCLEDLFKDSSCPNGYLYCGNSGSGHFVKMVHNAVEYGMMESIAEGFDLLKKAPDSLGKMNLKDIAEVWNHGSVVHSWLVELVGEAFERDEELNHVSSQIGDNGEGRWAVETALEQGVAMPMVALAICNRLRSRSDFSNKIVSALRYEFGRHK
ncbi:MAG: phosphogluconate dehydrogenase (NAD(+)-dependent, decarboxylating) [Candidatus Aenigmatarchaeota archaeon]